jgi:hypothetical protein
MVKIIECLAVSEVKAYKGRNEAKDVRYAFNDYIGVFLNDLR